MGLYLSFNALPSNAQNHNTLKYSGGVRYANDMILTTQDSLFQCYHTTHPNPLDMNIRL